MQIELTYEQRIAQVVRRTQAALEARRKRFCDVCDRPTTDWATFTAYGITTTACEACRGEAV